MSPTDQRTTSEADHRRPSLPISLLPLVVMALFLGVGYGLFQVRAEILLICSALVAGLVAHFLGYDWQTLEEGIVESIRQAMPAMLIVICVGLLIGSWIAAGTIPMLVYYGLEVLNPNFYLVTASLVCSLVSLFTGTSWGTVGTVGIAFIGIAQGFGIPLGVAAGAIISGAYFGDKISPFSDTTNLAPIAARSNLFDHIRHLLWTTTPAWLIGLVIYFFIGLRFSGNALPQAQIDLLTSTLKESFRFNILLLLPPGIILFAAIRKLPTIPFMVIASLLAALLAVWFQEIPLPEVLNTMTLGFKADTGLPELDNLLSRGGMMSMMDVTLIGFCAFAFAGIVQRAGMLDVILERLLRIINRTGSLVLATALSCITVAFITGSSFLSIIIPGKLYAPAFSERGLAAKNLSRTTEDSGTVIVPLVPWSMAGVFMAGTLNVPVLEYAPWAFMCYLGVVFAVLYGFSNFAIAPKIREDETIPGS